MVAYMKNNSATTGMPVVNMVVTPHDEEDRKAMLAVAYTIDSVAAEQRLAGEGRMMVETMPKAGGS